MCTSNIGASAPTESICESVFQVCRYWFEEKITDGVAQSWVHVRLLKSFNTQRAAFIAARFDQRTVPSQLCQHVVGGLPSCVYCVGGHTDVKADLQKSLRSADWRSSRKFTDVDAPFKKA